LALLRSAYKNAPTLKSVVVTGSVNALTTGAPDELKNGPLTNESWLSLTQEDARTAQNAYLSYCSGKKEGELALWDFVKTTSPPPSFSVTVLLPALIFGPPIQPMQNGIKGLNYSTGVIYSLMNGSNKTVPPTSFPSYIDVRDLADAHVKSLTTPEAANKRFLIGGASMTYTDLAHALAKVPELEGRIPADSDEAQNVVPVLLEADEGNKVLNMTFRSLDETMADMAKSLLALEKEA
jgi:nucleoside-diphosphate-sugar epimerase